MFIDKYKIFIFDLDGTIIDSEHIHHKSYNLQLKDKITFETYCDIFHSINKDIFCNLHKIDYIKKEKDFKEIYFKEGKLINGFEDFFKYLIENGKIIAIVTNSSKERCEFIKSIHPILNNIDLWITKNDVKNLKPHPESYIKAINELLKNNDEIKLEEIIIFEDSYLGLESIKNIDYITKIFMNTNNYKTNNYNYLTYNNYTNINDYNNDYNNDYKSIFQKYNIALSLLEKKANQIIPLILPLFINKNIIILGVGKSGIIATKCVSTWNSLGILANSLNVNDLFHGDFGKINDNSIIIYISNSGNTEELIQVAKHIKNEFNIIQISLTINNNNNLKIYCDYNYSIIDDIINEIDNLNKAPTTSSMIFMVFLDILGIEFRKKLGYFTEKNFIKFHPGGILGKQKIIDEIVIVACGKGSRLYPYTINIPKYLINLDNDNLLSKQINYWKKYSKSFVIIIEEKYNEITKFYCNLYNINYKIINVNINNNEENSYTIQQGLGTDYNNKNLIITWCDILLTDELDISKFTTNLIFTYGNECRYKANNNEIIKVNKGGNIIGCYFISNYKQIIIDNPKQDFCDIFINNFKGFNIYELTNIIDIGDLEKLDNYKKGSNNIYKTRYFNNITDLNNGYLKKEALDKKGLLLIKNEKNYYKIISFTSINNLFPKIIEYTPNYFIMEKLIGIPLYMCDNYDIYLELVFKSLESLHNYNYKIIDENEFDMNLKIEFYEKIIQRLNNIIPIINYLDISSINGINIKYNNSINYYFKEIIKLLFDDIKLFYKNKEKTYYIIHGDCNFSNIIKLTNDNQIKFIDPRGYFGNSYIYGIKEYDFSKIMYALSGYDNFNNNENYYFDYNTETKNINLNIPIIDLFKYKKYFENFDISLKMTIIHWFGLAEYNKNNIHKCIASFYNAIFMYNNFI